jgi:hypothetical protein
MNETSTPINDMLIELMQTMARLDQATRVELISEGLKNKNIAEPGRKPSGKSKNTELWGKVKADMAKHPNMNAYDLATLAGCGVATIYRIKRELKA